LGIKGLTDSVAPSFPRIGKLVKGAEATRDPRGNVIKIGADLSYFRFVSERPEVITAFREAYGEAPTLINAYLPHATVEAAFSCWKERWASGGLVHRCDGETMTIWLGTDAKYHRESRPCDGKCDEVGRLTILIPELVRAGFVGYVVLETHGINDLLSIQASLMAAWETRAGNPLGLRGIQWVIRRVKEKISTPMANGKRARRDKWLVKLEPAADWVQLQLQAAHNATMMLPAPSPVRASGEPAAAERVDPETGEIVEAPSGDEAPPVYEAQPEDPAVAFETAMLALADPLRLSAESWRSQMDEAESLDELADVHKRLNANRAGVRAALPALAAYLAARKAELELEMEEAAGEPPDEDAMASLFAAGK
jgi:hypothetical protein